MKILCLALLAIVATPVVAKPLDRTPRTVVTAFAPEWESLARSVERPKTYRINGLTFLTGTMAGKRVLLMQSGVSMVNPAMSTQLELARFTVRRIVFSGIAGGVDPALSIGDVVVPEHWAQYLQVSFARKAGEGWTPPESTDPDAPKNYGMMFPRGVRVGNAAEPARRHYAFPVDAGLLTLARKVATGVKLLRCVTEDSKAPGCLAATPKIVVGGTGVSAGVYADNAEFRTYLSQTYKAPVLDMESAAVAQVAYANAVPVIVFRSLSDLAGGDAGANQMTVFMELAAVNSADVVRAFVAALAN
jgi:adenosylhomocysteine nucleosidase